MLRDEGPTEEEKANELDARIKAPIVWGRLEDEFRIEDLQEKRYDEAMAILKDHFLNTDTLFKAINILEDEESVEEFLTNSRIQLKDKASLGAIEEATNNLVGVLVMRVFHKSAFSRTFNKVRLTHSPRYSAVMKFYNILEKPANLHKIYNANNYLKIISLAIHPDFRHKGIGREMYRCARTAAAGSNIDAIAGNFTCASDQELIATLGFVKHSELYYSKYIDGGEIVFPDTGPENYSAAFMASKICEDDKKEIE